MIKIGNTGGTSSGAVTSINGETGNVTITKQTIGLSDVNNTSDADKPVSTAQQTAITAVTTATDAKLLNYILASKMGAASGVATLDVSGTLASSQIPASLIAGLKWQGTIDVTTQSVPTASSSNNGYFYKNSVAGTSSITGTSLSWTVNDWLISKGTVWERVPNTLSNATSSSVGVVQLAGDLSGTATAPTVAKVNGITAPSVAPTAARKVMMSSSTSALQYDSLLASDLPDTTTAAKGVIQLGGDLSGTSTSQTVSKVNGWTVGNSPTLVNQVLAVTDVANKTLGYVAQSGGSGVVASYISVYKSTATAYSASTIVFDQTQASVGADITYNSSTGVFTVKAGKTYCLKSSCRMASSGALDYRWYNVTASTVFNPYMSASSNSANGDTGAVSVYFTPTVDTQLVVQMYSGSGTLAANQQWAEITVVSGTAAVSGQSIDYLFARNSTTQSITTSTGQIVVMNTTIAGNLTLSSNAVTLYAGKTYELEGSIGSVAAATPFTVFQFYDVTNSTYIGTTGARSASTSTQTYANAVTNAKAVITPTTNITIQLRIVSNTVAGTIGAGDASDFPYIIVKQLGTSSVIDMVGATASAAGIKGTVPAPAAGKQNSFLRGDATWDNMAWTSYTPTITGSITNPTLATTKTLLARYRQIGKSLQIAFTYYSATGTGAVIGSGAYMFSLPSGFTIDTTLAPIVTPTSVIGDMCGVTASALGSGMAGASSSAIPCIVVGSSSTTVSLFCAYDSSGAIMNTLMGSSGFSLTGTGKYYKFTAEIPIV